MIAALARTASDEERSALGAHLRACGSCRQEEAKARRLDAALAELAPEVPVPPALEYAVVRKIRERESAGPALADRLRAWMAIPVGAVAAAGVAAALMLGGSPTPAERLPSRGASVPSRDGRPAAEAGRPEAGGAEPGRVEPVQVAGAARSAPPAEPPPELAASLPILLDLPILRNMEKLENFERIEALSLADEDGGSSG